MLFLVNVFRSSDEKSLFLPAPIVIFLFAICIIAKDMLSVKTNMSDNTPNFGAVFWQKGRVGIKSMPTLPFCITLRQKIPHERQSLRLPFASISNRSISARITSRLLCQKAGVRMSISKRAAKSAALASPVDERRSS